jgi:hypothetical protein
MRLLHQEGGITFRYELRPGVNVLGRTNTCDVPLNDPAVSASHCELVLEENRVWVRDLQSTNGTYINDVPIQESELRAGDRLKLGTFELELEPPPQINIPEAGIPHERPTHLADGRLCCHNHSDVPAQARCVACKRHYCLECVHHIRRVGGAAIHLCPWCGQTCDPLDDVEMPQPRKRSFMGALQDTIRMVLNRK